MLQIRPSCENCGVRLAADSLDAMICSFECTFCSRCVSEILENVCPNCGGGFCPRPIRPAQRWRGDACLLGAPASTQPVSKPVDRSVHAAFAAAIKGIPPERR
jgi:hypothetical protein